jgi:HSP20 family protein
LKAPALPANRDPAAQVALTLETLEENPMTIFRYEPWRLNSVAWIPSVDVREEDTRFVVLADLPGVDSKDIEITAEKGVLTLRGERKSEARSEGSGFERVERVAGSFLRRFTLPETANADGISARHVNGVLEVTIPKQEQVQPKRITVQAA